jgi:hypothetical protein
MFKDTCLGLAELARNLQILGSEDRRTVPVQRNLLLARLHTNIQEEY